MNEKGGAIAGVALLVIGIASGLATLADAFRQRDPPFFCAVETRAPGPGPSDDSIPADAVVEDSWQWLPAGARCAWTWDGGREVFEPDGSLTAGASLSAGALLLSVTTVRSTRSRRRRPREEETYRPWV